MEVILNVFDVGNPVIPRKLAFIRKCIIIRRRKRGVQCTCKPAVKGSGNWKKKKVYDGIHNLEELEAEKERTLNFNDKMVSTVFKVALSRGRCKELMLPVLIDRKV